MVEKKPLSWPFYGWMAVIGIGILIGLYGAAMLLFKGHGLTTGTTDQMPWGTLISTYVFFVAASAGCVIVSLGHVLGIKRLELVMKRAVFLAIITLLAGGIVIILDLRSPLNMIYFLLSPNFGSPMWWMIFLYTLYLVLLVIDFYLLHKYNLKKARIFGVLAPLAAIAVHSTLGAIFGFAFVRTYFGGAFTPVYFILIALVIGTALLLFVTILQFRVTKKEMSPELHSLTTNLSKFLGVVLGIAIFFIIWKNLAGLYSPVETTALAYRYMLFGPASWWYWGIVILMGLIIPLILILNPGTRNLNGILAASTLVLIGMFTARIEFTIGGQVAPLFQGLWQPWQPQFVTYSPTFVEIAVVILAFALCALLYTLGSRRFALEEVPRYA